MEKRRLLGTLLGLVIAMGLILIMSAPVWAETDAHTHDGWTEWTSSNSLPSQAGNYYLTNDITILGAWGVPSGTTNLCLNGHTIKAIVNYGQAINIGGGAELHIYDEAEKTGKITAQGGTGVRLNGGTFVMHGGRVSECTWGGVYIANGTFILEDGSVQNNNWNNSGAGVKIAGSTARFIMNGGSVTGNKCNASYGGGVHVGSTGAYFEMNGGSITGNTCDRGSGGDGGGVYVNPGTFKMTGGSISGNKAAGHYGGVFIGENGIFELSGNVEINGNVGACNSEDPLSENLYLSSSRIIISGEMTNSDPIDIDMNALGGGVFTQSKNDVKASDYADKFVSAKKGFLVKAEGDELKLANEEPFTYLDSDGIEHTIDSYAYFSSVDITRMISLNEKWYVVDGEFEVINPIYINGKVNLILCDDAVLDAKKGITVPNNGTVNCTLGIYAKSTGDHTGRLIASGGNNDPGIGGGYAPCGIINIYGGNIKAVGGTGAAGIGGRENFIGGTVRIYGGTLEAIAGENAAAIGAGNGTDDHGTVTLGEKVKVLAGDDEANAEDVTSTFAEKHDQKWVKTAVRQTVTRTVTFKVVNGSWNEYEEEAAVSDKTVELTGMEGDTLNLAEDQIPAAGDKPNAGYKAGSWDTVPSTDTEITADTIYTYTYAAREASDDVIDAINALPAKTTASDKTKVEAARKAYNELNPEQKAKVPVETLVKLENAETVLNALDKADKAEKAKTDAVKAKEDAEAEKEKAEAAKKKAEAKAAKAKKATLQAIAKGVLVSAKGGKGKISVKWKALKDVKAYRVLISKNKKGTVGAKVYNINSTKKLSTVLKKIKKGTYYVRVRGFKYYKGNTVCGKYSFAKVVKVK